MLIQISSVRMRRYSLVARVAIIHSLAAIAVLICAMSPAYADDDVSIALKNNLPSEQETKVELQSLLKSYDLKDYLYTHKVMIDTHAIPHSDPILTLNTRHNGHPDSLLSTFVHEEIHWFVSAHEADELAAEKEYRQLFPNVPSGFPEGAQDEESTYLHLTVCYLEYQSMKKLVGDRRALAVIQYFATDHYTWIYKTVLQNESAIGAIVKRHHLSLKSANPPAA